MQNLENISFGAFWPVKGNPKKTAEIGHINKAVEKNYDYFISYKKHPEINCPHILLNQDQLPSLQYTKNLKHYCHSNNKTLLKNGRPIDNHAFFELSSIWLSKILFFERISKLGNFKNIIWRDCVFNFLPRFRFTYSQIQNHDSIKAIFNFHKKFTKNPFRGLSKFDFFAHPNKLSGAVIRIPTKILGEFIDRYIECLIYADNNFVIYDEEVVLTYMYYKHTHLFEP